MLTSINFSFFWTVPTFEISTYEIINPVTGVKYLPPKGRCWRTEPEKYKQLLEDKRIVFGKNGTSKPQLKVFYNEVKMPCIL